MNIDYAPFLHVGQNGSIWWQLADAIKLGAGYLPVGDDARDLNPVLRARNNRIRANERTLLSQFSQDHYTDAHPRVVLRDDCRYVDARDFLNWLAQYIAKTQSEIPFPGDLAIAVRDAIGKATSQPEVALVFDSLALALEGWFDKTLADLPAALRTRVDQEFAPMPWDRLSSEQRCSVAEQMDYQHDPATEQERKVWWDFFQREEAVEKQIADWEEVAALSATDLALKETRLAQLRQELERMAMQKRQSRGDYVPTRKPSDGGQIPSPSSPALPVQYVAYPKAMHQLAIRLGATPAELAAWIFAGPDDGGIAAYVNANELDPPPRFQFAIGSQSHEYVPHLMCCWFRVHDIDQFAPTKRYITGLALIERWSTVPGLHPEAFIRAKIAESRLLDSHPIYGQTRGAISEHAYFPPLETALFLLSDLEKIEAEDLPGLPTHTALPDTTPSVASQLYGGKPPDKSAGAAPSPTAAFLAMKNLDASELSLAFVGDRDDAGIGANNMLGVSARGVTRRVALAGLDLVNRRSGTLNGEGAVLLGFAHKLKLSHTTANAAKLARLRKAFRKHFGVQSDPFEDYQRARGWIPRFLIVDRRGAADERAKRDGESRTYSLEQLAAQGHQLADAEDGANSFDDADDPAADWLKENDPDRFT